MARNWPSMLVQDSDEKNVPSVLARKKGSLLLHLCSALWHSFLLPLERHRPRAGRLTVQGALRFFWVSVCVCVVRKSAWESTDMDSSVLSELFYLYLYGF